MNKRVGPGSSPVEDPVGYLWQTGIKTLKASREIMQMPVFYWLAASNYQSDFLIPFSKSVQYFNAVESRKMLQTSPLESYYDYKALLEINVELGYHAALSTVETMIDYHLPRISDAYSDVFDYIEHEGEILTEVAYDFPISIRKIADEFGFHFERGGSVKIDETDRFFLYQVLPNEKGVSVRNDGKPVLIVHPYVLGADILAFLPGENKSYVHCFANQGIPTYIRILKDIHDNPAAQRLTLEDDIMDTKRFCEVIQKNHGRPITLNGYCQGGLITLCNIISGKLDGLVDAHITCVAPIDGSRSNGLGRFLRNLPERFNDLAYGTKTLQNGNRVGDGDLMSWVYKLKSVREESPLVAFYRDMAMFDHLKKKGAKLSKTVLALNYWIYFQRHDLPFEITKISHASYNTPISKDGILPFKAFNRRLDIRRIAEKGIKTLICYGESDALVEKQCALAPLDYIEAEIAPFPKGHVAIATSWSLPTSEYALHTRFGEQGFRGPVRFHLDIEQAGSNPGD